MMSTTFNSPISLHPTLASRLYLNLTILIDSVGNEGWDSTSVDVGGYCVLKEEGYGKCVGSGESRRKRDDRQIS